MPTQGSRPSGGVEAIHNRDGSGKTEPIANRDSTGQPDVFIATTEPHGIIELCMRRKSPGEISEISEENSTEAETREDVGSAEKTSKLYPKASLTKRQFLNMVGGVYEKTPWIAESVADFLFGAIGVGVAGKQVTVDLSEVPQLLQATVDKGASREQKL